MSIKTVSVSEAAKIKGVTRQTIYDWLDANKISQIKRNGRIGIICDYRFERLAAQGARTQEYLYSEIAELQQKYALLERKYIELEGKYNQLAEYITETVNQALEEDL